MPIDTSVLTASLEARHLIIILLLYLFGMYLKKNLSVTDNYIPLILTGASLILCILSTLSVQTLPSTSQEIFALIYNILIQTLACVAGAVYFNQSKKQLIDKLMPPEPGEEEQK